MRPNDPLYSNQWHFDLIGDVEEVWNEYRGDGVRVVVYDDGIEQSHRDLDANYDTSRHYPGISGTGADNGLPNSSSNGHGTSVAGIIAAENNGRGGVGVAFDATLTSVDFLSDVQYLGGSIYYDALRYAANFEIMNNSWGSTPRYLEGSDIGGSGYGRYQKTAFEDVAQNGRDGLGTIIVKAAGNDANDADNIDLGILGNASGDGKNNLAEFITVAATDRAGDVANYSNWGSSILVAAPAASVTTDRSGSAGYSSGDFTDRFGGTSAATPVVSGVVALLLEANPDLGWRDVQNILSLSASQTGSDFGSSGAEEEVGRWASNGASGWNGGGVSYHSNYGLGMVDAFAAVRFAENWELFSGDAFTSANEMNVSVSYSGSSRAIRDGATAELQVHVTQAISIEHIYVTVNYTHSSRDDLTLELLSPSGDSFLLTAREMGDTSFDGDWTYGVTGALGMSSVGNWRLRVTDSQSGDQGSVRDVDLEFRGSAWNNDSTYHFTKDFLEFSASEIDRRRVEDTDGGQDWVNLSGMTGNVRLALIDRGQLEVVNRYWTTFENGDAIEGAVLGGGNDTVIGGNADNIVYGRRGNDHLSGALGSDTLQGDGGADLLEGGLGTDVLDGGRGSDQLFGGSGADVLVGASGDDFLNGDSSDAAMDGMLGQIYRVYLATLGRVPDAEGHLGWVNRLQSGALSLADVVSGFVESTEFQARYGSASDPEFVSLLYQNVLDRTPDPTGLQSWLNALGNQEMSREQVVLGFSESTEFQNRTHLASLNYNAAGYEQRWADDVYRLYQATLDRAPDLVGLQNWCAELLNGTRFDDVIRGFVNSREFQLTYGSTSNDEFVALLYDNVLGRAPDADGLAHWLQLLDAGSATREFVVRGFSESREFISATAGAFADFMMAQGSHDRLEAGGGTNLLVGGMLADTFVFDGQQIAQSTVFDLETWDRIELSNFGVASGAAAINMLNQVGADVILSGGNTTVSFLNTQISDFTEDMFIFA